VFPGHPTISPLDRAWLEYYLAARTGEYETAHILGDEAKPAESWRAILARVNALTTDAPTKCATNATPSPIARFDECPHHDAHLRSAARHCHPPITRPAYVEIGTNLNDSGSAWRQQGGLLVAVELDTAKQQSGTSPQR
jgi:hypothetical protein